MTSSALDNVNVARVVARIRRELDRSVENELMYGQLHPKQTAELVRQNMQEFFDDLKIKGAMHEASAQHNQFLGCIVEHGSRGDQHVLTLVHRVKDENPTSFKMSWRRAKKKIAGRAAKHGERLHMFMSVQPMMAVSHIQFKVVLDGKKD